MRHAMNVLTTLAVYVTSLGVEVVSVFVFVCEE